MKSITVSGLSIQFDADQITSGSDLSQAKQAIEEINLILQRQPYGLSAQILNEVHPNNVSSEEADKEE